MAFMERKSPAFALCGLNCCLCPRYNTDGASKCPGCGGPGFKDKHPSCGVMTCAAKHGGVEYCYECAEYPCPKYMKASDKDSFTSYATVLGDFRRAESDLSGHLAALRKKEEILSLLIERYNDGRLKTFYCVIVNNLPYEELRAEMDAIEADEALAAMDGKERAKEVARRLKERAEALGVPSGLRK